MSNYPPGVSAHTRNAPWNQPPAPKCECCEEIIRDDADHAEDCPERGRGPNEIYQQREEDAEVARAEAQMEDQRLREHERA